MKIKDFEISIIKGLRDFSTPFLDKLLEMITILGEQYVLIVILAVIYFTIDKKMGQRITYSIFTSLVLNNTIKGIVKYERPFVYDTSYTPVRPETATGYSFPSGHTQNSSVTYTSLAINFKKKWLWIVVGIAVFLIGFSRVYLGVHYPKDVLVGWILGIGCAFLCNYLHNKFASDSLKKQMLLYIITLLIFVPFVFIFYRSSYEDMVIFKDFYVGFAMFLGFIPAVYIESKYVNFDCNCNIMTKVLRLVGAVIVILIFKEGLKPLFKLISENDSVLLDMIRYFLMTFVGLGIYPLVFKKLLFKKEDVNK